jgi:hypothetical protein
MADEGLGEVGAQPPIELGKSLRCCVPCRLVKTFEQFYEQARRCLLSSEVLDAVYPSVAAVRRKRPSSYSLPPVPPCKPAAARREPFPLLINRRAAKTVRSSPWMAIESAYTTAQRLSSK